MKFGLAVTGRANPKILEKMAIKADSVGYDSFLVTDHFMLPEANNHVDVWSFLPYLAAKTEHIRLGTCVTPLPFRRPGVLAKMISTTDNLSNGRVILGAGFGWYQPEFDGFSQWLSTKDRIAFSEEATQLMIRLWSDKAPVDFSGKFLKASGAIVESPTRPETVPSDMVWRKQITEPQDGGAVRRWMDAHRSQVVRGQLSQTRCLFPDETRDFCAFEKEGV